MSRSNRPPSDVKLLVGLGGPELSHLGGLLGRLSGAGDATAPALGGCGCGCGACECVRALRLSDGELGGGASAVTPKKGDPADADVGGGERDCARAGDSDAPLSRGCVMLEADERTRMTGEPTGPLAGGDAARGGVPWAAVGGDTIARR